MSRIYELLHRSGNVPDLFSAPISGVEEGRLASRPERAGHQTAPASRDISLLARALQRNWRLSAACMLAVVASVTAATLLMKPVYEPEAHLEVDPPGNELFALDVPHVVSSDTEYLQTQVQNLQSEELAVAVIRKLHLAPDSVEGASDTDPSSPVQQVRRLTPGESDVLRDLQRQLKVEHDPGSHLISVAVGTHDPVQAATITNAFAFLFIGRTLNARQEAIVQSVEWLSRQLEDIRKRMEDSNRAFADFQRKSGVADIDQGKSTSGEMLAELNKQLTQSAADRIQLESLLKKVRDKNPAALPQVQSSVLIQQLTQKLSEVRAELAQARVTYGGNHPNVKRLESQANELEAQVNGQKRDILEEVKTAYAAAQAREQLMSGQVGEATRRLSLMAQYNALKREAEANTTLYNTLYSKIKEAGISAASKSSNVRVVDQARVLDRPTRPRRLLNLMLGLIAGLVFGLGAAFVREGLDGTLRTTEDVRQCDARLPVSIVPVIESNGDFTARPLRRSLNGRNASTPYELLLLSRPMSAEAEAVRALRTALILSRTNRPPQALLIASSLPGEGKTTLALNLATALAQQGLTCILDCDLRNSVVSTVFERTSEEGLAEVLTGAIPLREAVFRTEVPDLFVFPAGCTPEDAGHLISSSAMRDTLAALRRRFDFMVIDSPPILPYADGRVLSTLVDGVVFVGRPRVTTREAMTRSLELLAEVRSAPILEVVLNAAERDCPDYQYSQYGYKSRRAM